MEQKNMNVSKLGRNIVASLSPKYGEGEAKAMMRLIFHHLKGWSLTDLAIHSDNIASDYLMDSVIKIIERLHTGEPLQYILGEAYFYGMNLKVNRHTLIPRPETAELVDLIVKENSDRKDLHVLDIGTGSGAIAIALARNLPFSDVSAIDISADAIAVAKENATNLHASVNFRQEDVFTFKPERDSLDIVVSNPPYIDESEKSEMNVNVLEYEPATALFVPDDNPLIFYKAIAETAKDALVRDGKMYFEINPRHADDLISMLESYGFKDVCMHRDISGKNRFIICRNDK